MQKIQQLDNCIKILIALIPDPYVYHEQLTMVTKASSISILICGLSVMISVPQKLELFFSFFIFLSASAGLKFEISYLYSLLYHLIHFSPELSFSIIVVFQSLENFV